MGMPEALAILITILSLWGSLWYKIGRLTSEVKGHNLKLAELQKAVERFIIYKGG